MAETKFNLSYFASSVKRNVSKQKSETAFRFIKQLNFVGFSVVILLLIFSSSCKKKETIDIPAEGMPKLWITQLPAESYYCSPALSHDEKTVYIGTSSPDNIHMRNHFFVALDAEKGTENWKLELGVSDVRSAPAVASDHSIYFAVQKHDANSGVIQGDELWHVSGEGVVLWKYDINPQRMTIDIGLSAPAIGQDGVVIIGGDQLYAIEPDGSLRWAFSGSFPESIRNAPAIGSDGTIYFVFHNVPLTALDPTDGSVIWSLPLGVNDHCFASPAIANDGTIYVATQPGLLFAVSKDGQLLWTFDIASLGYTGYFRGSPSIGADGSVFLGLEDGNPISALFCVNSGGTLKWVYEPTDLPDNVPTSHFDIYSSPALGSDGLVYFGQEFGRVYALKASNGSLVSITTTSNGITWSSPAIDKKGVLYICDLSGKVFAIQTGSQGLDPLAQWPKYRFDNQNRGRKF